MSESPDSKSHNQSVGIAGENAAVTFLEEKDYLILDRNYNFMHSEIDIVASTDREIVFVEVKARSTNKFGEPEDAISEAKKKSMVKVAEAWLHERKLEGAPVRFDVISVMRPGKSSQQIKHYEGAFWFV